MKKNNETPQKRQNRRLVNSSMAYETARRTAQAILERRKKGGTNKISVSEIAREVGYSKSSSTSAVPQQTKTFQELMTSFTGELAKERDRQLRAMQCKPLEKEPYKVLSEALTRSTHDIQLLTGGATERMQYDKETAQLKAIIAGLIPDNTAIHKDITDITHEKLDPPRQ